MAWADAVLPRLSGLAKAMYGVGRFLEVDGPTVVFALPNEAHRRKCEQKRAEVEAALSSRARLVHHVAAGGRRRPPRCRPADLIADEQPPPSDDEELSALDVRDLQDAPAGQRGGVDRLTEAFPGR